MTSFKKLATAKDHEPPPKGAASVVRQYRQLEGKSYPEIDRGVFQTEVVGV